MLGAALLPDLTEHFSWRFLHDGLLLQTVLKVVLGSPGGGSSTEMRFRLERSQLPARARLDRPRRESTTVIVRVEVLFPRRESRPLRVDRNIQILIGPLRRLPVIVLTLQSGHSLCQLLARLCLGLQELS